MESLVHYSNPSHALSVLGQLNEQRLRGQMCDVLLVVADQKYCAHKSVLAASSEYFQSLFTQIDTEAPKVVNLDFCEPDAFEIVLNYIYCSSLFVDKSSLAAIQELGYSLGIPFLTNIVSVRPHASYCVSRKRFSFSEGDENDVQARSVIVRRVKMETPNSSSSIYPREPSGMAPSPQTVQPPSVQNSFKSVRTSESTKSSALTENPERKSIYPYVSILKGNLSQIASVRPQLTSSVSFSDAEVQHMRLQSDQGTRDDSGEYEPNYHTKVPFQGPAQEPSPSIDRSGPLIKSLLRRSLSMDSPIPVFSPTLELRDLQHREQSVVKMAAKVSGPEAPVHNGSSKRASPLVLRSRCPSRYDVETQVEKQSSMKDEPSSPLADPMDIVRITVGDSLPVCFKDFQYNYEQSIQPDVNLPVKRKDRPDNRRYPFKKNKIFKEHGVCSEENVSEAGPPSGCTELDENSEEPPPGKTFKCWNCLKVFRSNAGLHRHVNMYHNPEKPYACDICHKRFHTNFKVWTHSQTQHGVVQNPASSSSTVLDEKFQKKLIDIVREREIKKALLWKLKRNKQSLQSSVLNKKRSRTNFVCPYCGKVFVFQSQYRQHLKSHHAERTEPESREDMHPEELTQEKNADSGVYSCRLCNVKLSSLFEQGDHERGCRHATVCPYCGLRFSSPAVKKDHEAHCKYKKLTCLECMRTFKSSFSIWRHQVEVHNHNMMTVKDQLQFKQQENHQDESHEELFREEPYSGAHLGAHFAPENSGYSNSGPPNYDSEDSSSYVPEDLSMSNHGKLVVKEEPMEEAVSERENADTAKAGSEEPGVWPCEKCGNLFSSRKDLERHQELLCHIKPFICHICGKAFRTNFRLWSHFQSHMSAANEQGAKEIERQPSPLSPSPPLTPQNSECPPAQAAALKTTQPAPAAASMGEESSSPEPSASVGKSRTEFEPPPPTSPSPGPISRANSLENQTGPQEPDTLFYHAPSLSALTFKRQYMCKLCHRTFKTAFSLWSHEQSHNHM